MEGDFFFFMFLMNNGLNVFDYFDWGGWGGCYELYMFRMRKWYLYLESCLIWVDVEDEVLGIDGKWY